jgi:4-aminobutyrate aminotransferase-like enzyme
MGDVHPHPLKARLARELSRITFERWAEAKSEVDSGSRTTHLTPRASGKTIFCNSGFEAVEAALKTAMLATGKRGVIAFEGAYHGLGYGALNATHREHFRGPFKPQLGGFAHFVPFPVAANASSRLNSHTAGKNIGRRLTSAATERLGAYIQRLFRRHSVGTILVEPIQVRGGINLPPREFLPLLRRLCNEHGALLILDEIYTGFGRTGKWFACEYYGVVPDLICLGKALTGGFPLSACVGRADLMDTAWPASSGEAIHTSTFLGHPVGCAMALAQIAEIRRRNLVERSAQIGPLLLEALSKVQGPKAKVVCEARGAGLLAGIELRHADGSLATAMVLRVIKAMLRRGFILLPEGEHANVISFTPPLTITERQLRSAVQMLAEVLT